MTDTSGAAVSRSAGSTLTAAAPSSIADITHPPSALRRRSTGLCIAPPKL